MSLLIAQHPLVGMILRQTDRPWDRFKVVSVTSGSHQSIEWIGVGKSMPRDTTTGHQMMFHLLEVDPDQTDGPIDRHSPRRKLITDT